MNFVYGGITIGIGLFFLISALLESEFILYQLFVARSKMLWKDNVHHFYKVIGVILMIVGVLFMIVEVGV